MTARYKSIPAKGVYLPNSPCFGFNSYMLHTGYIVRFKEGEHTRTGRALDLVTQGHDGPEYRKPTGRGKQTKLAPKVRVLAFDDLLTHAFERWVDVEDIVECRKPSAEHGAFARAMLTGTLPSPEACIAASNYGTLSDCYFVQVADESGNLPEDWRARTNAHHARVSADNEARRVAREAGKVTP